MINAFCYNVNYISNLLLAQTTGNLTYVSFCKTLQISSLLCEQPTSCFLSQSYSTPTAFFCCLWRYYFVDCGPVLQNAISLHWNRQKIMYYDMNPKVSSSQMFCCQVLSFEKTWYTCKQANTAILLMCIKQCHTDQKNSSNHEILSPSDIILIVRFNLK